MSCEKVRWSLQKQQLFQLIYSGFFLLTFLSATRLPQDQKAFTPEIDFLKNIHHFSDEELQQKANRILSDDVPGEEDYAQIILIEAIRKNPKNIFGRFGVTP